MHGQMVCRHDVEEDDNQLFTKFMREETSMNESNVQHKMTGLGNFSPFMGKCHEISRQNAHLL